MHIVDDVQGVDVEAGQPIHHHIELLHDLVIVQGAAPDGQQLRPYLVAADFIPTAVNGVEEALGQVGPGAEELHLLAHPHGGNTAGNGVVVAELLAHHVVALILDGGGLNGQPGAELLEILRQAGAPKHRHVGFRGGAQVGEGVQVTVGVLGDHVAAVSADTANGLRDPGGVAGEELVVFRGAQEPNQAQLHNKLVDDFLDFRLRIPAVFQIPLGIDVQEGGGAAQRHSRAVLLLHCGQIGEVQPLDSFLGVLGGTGDVKAVALAQALELFQGLDLLGHILPAADGVGVHDVIGQAVQIRLLGLDEEVRAIQGHTAVVADNAAAAISVGQAGDDVAVAGLFNVGGVYVKNAVVVGLAVFEDFFYLGVHFAAISLQGLAHHADAAKGHNGALQGGVGLQAHNDLFFFINIARCISVDVADSGGVHIQHAAGLALFFQQLLHFVPQLFGALGGGSQKALVPVIGGIVPLDKILYVYGMVPMSADKIFHESVPFFCRSRGRAP